MKFKICNFQTDFSDCWLRNLLWNCPNMNVTGLNWWSVNIGSGNGLVPSGNKPWPEPMLTQISCRCMVSLGQNELISITGPRTSTGWLMTTLQWHHMSTMASQITGNSNVYLTHWGWDEISDILQMTFQINFSYENCRILILISLKFIPNSPIINKSADNSLVTSHYLNQWW